MAAPGADKPTNGKEKHDTVLRRRAIRRQQSEAAFRAMLKRRFVHIVEGPAEDTVTEVVVLQKDFDNQVSSPTGGYIKAEVVIDTATNTVTIYVPP